jgi:hypothetical protein
MFSFSIIDHQIIRTVFFVSGIKLNEEFRIFGLQHFGIELIVLSGIVFLRSFIHDRNKFFLLAIITLIILFFAFLFQYAVNIPINDDCWTILHFSNHYIFSHSIQEKMSLLTSFHCESRIVTMRTILIILHFITGVVNIKSVIILANCCLPVILFLFYKFILSEKFRMEITLIIALLFFHFGYYDTVVWASGAILYQFTITFFMLSTYLLRKNSCLSKTISIISGLFAALTTGNGLLVFPLAILFFVIEKKWKFVLIWTAISIIFVICYFLNYFTMIHVSSPPPLFDYFIYSFCFLGSAFQFMYKLYLPFFIGFLIWVLFITATLKKYYKKNYFIYNLMLFVILSSFIAAHFRLSYGLNESISNRYGFFSILSISASIIAVSEMFLVKRQKLLLNWIICICIVYHLLSGIFFFPEVPVRKQKLESFITDIKNNTPFKPIPPFLPAGSDSIVREAIQKKIYFP